MGRPHLTLRATGISYISATQVPEGNSILLTKALTFIDRATRPTNPDGSYPQLFAVPFDPELFLFQICVLGGADWDAEDLWTFAESDYRVNLKIEKKVRDSLRRRLITRFIRVYAFLARGNFPPVDFEKVRCQVYLAKPGDLTVEKQLELLENMTTKFALSWKLEEEPLKEPKEKELPVVLPHLAGVEGASSGPDASTER